MTSAARLFGFAAVCAAPLIAGVLVEPVRAQGDSCKTDLVTAETGRRIIPVIGAKNQKKELDGDGTSMRDAVANWERQVGDNFGEKWKDWAAAKDTTFDCRAIKGKLAGTYVRCTVSGRPCMAKADDAKKKDDDKSAKIVPGKPVILERNRLTKERELDRRQWDRERDRRRELSGYEREIEYQRYLEEERRQRETRRYEREMEYQAYLAEKRRKREADAWERENARQRHLAEERRRGDRPYTRGRPDWDDDD